MGISTIVRSVVIPAVAGVVAAWSFHAVYPPLQAVTVPPTRKSPQRRVSLQSQVHTSDRSLTAVPDLPELPNSAARSQTRVAESDDAQFDPVQWHAHHVTYNAQLVAAHEREPVDRGWAAGAEAAFSEDLSVVASKNGFEIARTDCRTTSCIASIHWPSRTLALGTYQQLLTARYKMNCSKEILIPDADDATAPIEATLVLDCTELRNGEVQ